MVVRNLPRFRKNKYFFFIYLLIEYFDFNFHLGDVLYVGEELKPGEKLISQNGKFVLDFLSNQTIIIRIDRVVLWSSATRFGRGNRLSMQKDGRAVLFDEDNKEIFSTPSGGNYFRIENNGELVLRDNILKKIWFTQTTHSKKKKILF